MSHPDYLPSDFSPPLSDDAAIMLLFVQEKKRRFDRLRAEVTAIAICAFFAGVWAGAEVSRFLLTG